MTEVDSRQEQIIDAMADIFVDKTGLLPQAHLVAGVQDHGTSGINPVLRLDTVAGFIEQAHLHWFDNTLEPMAAIKAVDATAKTITLDYAGYQSHGFIPGLNSAHVSGALVSTNLMLHRPLSIYRELRLGLPVIAMWPKRSMPQELVYLGSQETMIVRIQVHLALQQQDSDPMDPEAYNDMQQKIAWRHMRTVLDTLDANRHLMSRYNSPGNHAQGLGDGKNKQFAEAVFDVQVEDVEIPQVVSAMNVTVRPFKHIRGAVPQ